VEARDNPDLARRRSGDLEKEVSTLHQKRGNGSVKDCTTRTSKNDESSTQESAEVDGRPPRAPSKNVDSNMVAEVLLGKAGREEVAGIHPNILHGKHSGGPCTSTNLPKQLTPSNTKIEFRVADGSKRCREHNAQQYTETGGGSHARDSGNSSEIRTITEDQNGTRGGMGDGRQGGGCNKTPQSGRGVRPERNPSPLRGGEDGHQRTLHGGNGETVTGGSQIRGGPEGGTRSDPMALSPGARGTPEVGPAQGEPPVGTKVHPQRGPPVPLGTGGGGRKADALLPAPQRADPQALPGLRVAVGGGGGEVVGGSGVKYWRGRTPQYFVKHFLDPPSWEDIQLAFPRSAHIQRRALPLNVKRVEVGDFEKLLNLPVEYEEGRAFWVEATRILHDSTFYSEAIAASNLSPNQFRSPSLSLKEIESMVGGKLERASSMPTWGVLGFKVAEPQKHRCRAIFDCDLNRVFKTSPKYTLKNKHQVRMCCFKRSGKFVFLQFDFVSFYDQFVLAFAIRGFFGLLFGDLYYNLVLLPMGFRLAVSAAQATMWLFLNFIINKDVNIATCIDNVCFSGDSELVLPVVDKFLERVFSCNFTLNGMKGEEYLLLQNSERMELLKSMTETNPDFLGENYNLELNKRKMTEKTVGKIELVWKCISTLHSLTNRQFFSLIGLLVYATGVLCLPTVKYFNLFRKIRLLSAKLNGDESLWDAKLGLRLTSLEFSLLEEWVHLAQSNTPVDTLAGKKEPPPINEVSAMFIVVDASVWGWGALLFDHNKTLVKTAACPWKNGEDFSSSVKAEPRGAREAVFSFKTFLKDTNVCIVTDHESLVWASQAMFTHSFWYNSCFTYLNYMEKQLGSKFYFYFLEGKRNIADSLSRGKGMEDITFPQFAGSGLGSALQRPWQL